MLVVDDYNEMIFLQSFMRKIGVDVEALQNVKKLKDTLLSFNPRIVVFSAQGNGFNGVKAAAALSRRAGLLKVCILNNSGKNISQSELNAAAIDAVIDSPVNPVKFIEIISSLADIKSEPLLEKFSKFQAANELQKLDASPTNDSSKFNLKKPEASYEIISGNSSPRKNQYAYILKKMPSLGAPTFSKEKVTNLLKEINKTPLPNDYLEVEDERQRFIKSLFKKALN